MPPNPPPPADMLAWNSYLYWRASNERTKQYWYVSFCLMMSSVQDRLTGLALRESGNLNWATTAFYYSAVHAGRLLCFLCSGDYPTGHADLATLLGAGTNGRAKFDWLKKFHAYVGAAGAAEPIAEMHGIAADLRTSLLDAVHAGFPGASARVATFSPLLSKFKNLRNDCNYEALLVAHERNHFLVTEGFEHLVDAADKASAIATDMAIALYTENLTTAACFHADRPEFLSAHRLYLRGRFEQSLCEKFGHSPAAMGALRAARTALTIPDSEGAVAPTNHEVEGFLDAIMYDHFGQKQGLMARWKTDVGALKAIVGT